jgi:hypothetical protein
MARVRFQHAMLTLAVVGGSLALGQSPALSDPDVGSVSGSALGERVDVTLPTGTRVQSGPLPVVKLPPRGGGPFTRSVAAAEQPGLLSTGALTVTTEGATGPGGFSRTSSEVVGVSLVDAVTADVVRAECQSTSAGSTGTTTLVGARVLGEPLAANPAPNTTIALAGLGSLTLNEQRGRTTYTDGRSDITVTVTAIHLRLNSALTGKGDIVVAQAHCDVGPPSEGAGGPLSGAAFGERIRVLAPIGTKVSSGPLPTVSLPGTGGGPITRSAATVSQPGLLSTGAMTVSTEGTTTPSLFSHSSAEVAGADIAEGAVTADAIRSECQSTTDGSSGTTTLLGAEVFGETISAEPAPNTAIDLAGLGTLILNEQTGALTPDDGKTDITVNAVHLILDSPTKGTGDIVIASSHCDVRLP